MVSRFRSKFLERPSVHCKDVARLAARGPVAPEQRRITANFRLLRLKGPVKFAGNPLLNYFRLAENYRPI
jgi:hypothetical protein